MGCIGSAPKELYESNIHPPPETLKATLILQFGCNKAKKYDPIFLVEAYSRDAMPDDSGHCRIALDIVALIFKYFLPDLLVDKNENKLLSPDMTHSYDIITICECGVLSTREWNGTNGGTLKLKANKIHLWENGKIQVNGKGYRGGDRKRKEQEGTAYQGESFNGRGAESRKANHGGGGGGMAFVGGGSSGGGGGGYGSNGSRARSGGAGGSVYGDSKLSTLHLGSGGGAGHPYRYHDGYEGGCGGGALQIECNQLVIAQSAAIEANGNDAPSVQNKQSVSGGGGGSGGSIYISAQQILNDGQISAMGGRGATQGKGAFCGSGGDGGVGRIRMDYANMTGCGQTHPPAEHTRNFVLQDVDLSVL